MFCATRAHSRTVLHHLRHRHGLKHQARGARNVHGGGPVVIGIRREDPLRIWERRCPLTPEAVQTLIQDEGVSVLVQPCERRIFTMDQFKEVHMQHSCVPSVLTIVSGRRYATQLARAGTCHTGHQGSAYG